MYRYGCLLLLILSPLIGFSQQVSGKVDRNEISVGDPLTYTITVSRTAGIDAIVYPDSTHFGRHFDLENRHEYSGVHADSMTFNLRYFGIDDAQVPQLPVGLVSGNDTVWVNTASIPLEFISRISDENEPFRPFKPLYEFSISLLPYIIGLLLLAMITWMGWRYYRNREIPEKPPVQEPVEIPPFVNPLQTLESDLHQIEADFPHPMSDYKAYFYRLGDAIRWYFEDLYNIPALESTTTELEQLLRAHRVNELLRTHTLAILRKADMVKFARFKPDSTDCINAIELAYDFLNEAREIDGTRVNRLKLKYDRMVNELKEREVHESQYADR